MTLATTTALLLSLAIFDEPETRPKPKPHRPVVMVLASKGPVTAAAPGGGPRSVWVEMTLIEGETIDVPPGSTATIAVLGAGLKQVLKGCGKVAVGPKGCKPSAKVEQVPLPRALAATMLARLPAPEPDKVGVPAGRSVPGPVVEEVRTRPAPEPRVGPIAPIPDATIDDLRPAFSWPQPKGATSYRVHISKGKDVLWEAKAATPKLSYPRDARPLRRGDSYRWVVTDQAGKAVFEGDFQVAGAEESKQLAELKPLASSKDPADLLAAALSYDRLGAKAEALACYEALVKLAPDEGHYRESRDRLRRLANIPADPK